MSGLAYLLDTNIISRIMADPDGVVAQRATQWAGQAQNAQICTSVVVQCELLFGLRRKPSQRLKLAYEVAMRLIDVLPPGDTVPPHYTSLRSQMEAAGTPLGSDDTLNSAQALAMGANLVSTDEAFTRVPGLRVENGLQAN